MKRYTIQCRMVEVDEQGKVVQEWSGYEMDVATTDINAFFPARFTVACEKRVEEMVMLDDLDKSTLSKTNPSSSLPKLWFVPPLEPKS